MNIKANTEMKETKLIIEGKEFEVIPFKVESSDVYYIPELNLNIRKSFRKN
jgi:hypothetical protein